MTVLPALRMQALRAVAAGEVIAYVRKLKGSEVAPVPYVVHQVTGERTFTVTHRVRALLADSLVRLGAARRSIESRHSGIQTHPVELTPEGRALLRATDEATR
jgi:hypothetical protein